MFETNFKSYAHQINSYIVDDSKLFKKGQKKVKLFFQPFSFYLFNLANLDQLFSWKDF